MARQHALALALLLALAAHGASPARSAARARAPTRVVRAPRCTARAVTSGEGGLGAAPGSGRGSVVVVDAYSPSDVRQSLDALLLWLRETHGAHIDPAIELDPSLADGRGLFIPASRAPPGLALLKLPLAACITEHTCLADAQLGGVMGALLAKSGPGSEVVPVVALLLRERGRGRASPWWPYVESLPWAYIGAEQVSPLFWTEAELQRLQGSRALREALSLRRQLASVVEILFPIFRAQRIRVMAPAGRGANAYIPLSEAAESWFSTDRPPEAFAEAVREAFALVLSRRISLPGLSSTVLCPLVDRLAYAPSDATAAVEFEAEAGAGAGAARGLQGGRGAPAARVGAAALGGHVVVSRELDSADERRSAQLNDSWEIDQDERALLERAAAAGLASSYWTQGDGAPGAAEDDDALGADAADDGGARRRARASAADFEMFERFAFGADELAAQADEPSGAFAFLTDEAWAECDVGAHEERDDDDARAAARRAAAQADGSAGAMAAGEFEDEGLLELSLCYNGCTSNAELLTYYGLAPQSLPPETCRASVVLSLVDADPYFYPGAPREREQPGSSIAAAAPAERALAAADTRVLAAWKLAMLADVGLAAERQEFEIGLPGEPFHVPPDLLGYLRLAAIVRADEREAVERCESPWQLLCGELCLFDAVPVSEAVDRDAARRLEAACKRALAAYGGGALDGAPGGGGAPARPVDRRAAAATAPPSSAGLSISPIEERPASAQRSAERAVDAQRLVMSEQNVLRATVDMLDTFSFRWLARCSMIIDEQP
jgi:hypothetical protein